MLKKILAVFSIIGCCLGAWLVWSSVGFEDSAMAILAAILALCCTAIPYCLMMAVAEFRR